NWESGDGGDYSTAHSWAVTFTRLQGNHNLRFGSDFRVYRENFGRYPLDVSPQLIFNTNYTRGPFDSSTAPPVGAELASFLLGVPGGELDRTATEASQDKYFAVYVQDDYKLTRKLTLNIGLRLEHEWPITERYNRSVATFDYNAGSPIEAQAKANYARNPIPELPVSQFAVRGGLTFAGVNGRSREYWKGPTLDIMPRFGFAYQL